MLLWYLNVKFYSNYSSARETSKMLTAKSNKEVDRNNGAEEGEGCRRACRFAGNIKPYSAVNLK
jgi:hypothetical protein